MSSTNLKDVDSKLQYLLNHALLIFNYHLYGFLKLLMTMMFCFYIKLLWLNFCLYIYLIEMKSNNLKQRISRTFNAFNENLTQLFWFYGLNEEVIVHLQFFKVHNHITPKKG